MVKQLPMVDISSKIYIIRLSFFFLFLFSSFIFSLFMFSLFFSFLSPPPLEGIFEEELQARAEKPSEDTFFFWLPWWLFALESNNHWQGEEALSPIRLVATQMSSNF